MNKFFAAFVFIAMMSCGSSNAKLVDADGKAVAGEDYLKTEKDSVLIPAFQVELNLSPAANARLLSNKESVIVHAWFSGQPKDTLSKEYLESGAMHVSSAAIELTDKRIAAFTGLKFPKTIYDSLAHKDISVLINVYSGRKSSPDNLLDCAILSEKMSAVSGKKFILAGKLINETDSLPQ